MSHEKSSVCPVSLCELSEEEKHLTVGTVEMYVETSAEH